MNIMPDDKKLYLQLLDSSQNRVVKIVINGSAFARKSPHFQKLFGPTLAGAPLKELTDVLEPNDVGTFVRLINVICSGSLTDDDKIDMVNLLLMCYHFEVPSGVEYCVEWLSNPTNLTPKEASSMLDVPNDNPYSQQINALKPVARNFLHHHFQEFSRLENQSHELSLQGLKVVLAGDCLKSPPSEDHVYDVLLHWAHQKYPEMEIRKEIVAQHLAPYIRFPFLTTTKLAEFSDNISDFAPEFIQRESLEALFFKNESLHEQIALADADVKANWNPKYHARDYTKRLLKIVELEKPHCVSIAHLELSFDDCESLFPSGEITSQDFKLVDTSFYLSARPAVDHKNDACIGFYLCIRDPTDDTVLVDLEVEAIEEPDVYYGRLFEETCEFNVNNPMHGADDLLHKAWKELDTPEVFARRFKDGFMRLRVQCTLVT